MDVNKLIARRVHDYYWQEDLNCATTMLKILAEIFELKLKSQVLHSAIGMHGAGGFRAQCGLVEGALMFVGILGREKGISESEIVDICYRFADEFESGFGSLLCRELRPEGFREDNPPHLCEEMSKDAVQFTVNFMRENVVEDR
ncbi:MAG: C-GCAxxG-C-C family protein [Halanaerobiales bacterium]